MTTAAIDFNDAAITLLADGRVLAQESGHFAAQAPQPQFGDEARAFARLRPHEASGRHWRDLGDAPLPRALGAYRSPADLVHAHLARLRALLPSACTAVIGAVPSYWTNEQLGLLLGIAQDVQLPLRGLVDSAVACSRRPYPGRELWALELSLHDVALTHIVQGDGDAVRGEVQRHDGLSVALLERTAAQFFARAFLRASRFDPLHDARSEQALHRDLPQWLASLGRQESLEVRAQLAGNEFTATVRATDLAAAMARAVERLAQKLRALVPAGGAAVLQVSDTLATWPGVLEALAQLAHWEIAVLEPGAAAAGALRLRPAPEGAPLHLAMRLPWNRPAATASPPRAAQSRGARPTHVVHAGRAWRLGAHAFHVGTELASGEFGVQLPAALHAVSRRHCTIRLDDGRAVLHDHSRFGTRLNGEPIEGSAVLHAGDVIMVGQPAVELALVTEVAGDAATA